MVEWWQQEVLEIICAQTKTNYPKNSSERGHWEDKNDECSGWLSVPAIMSSVEVSLYD